MTKSWNRHFQSISKWSNKLSYKTFNQLLDPAIYIWVQRTLHTTQQKQFAILWQFQGCLTTFICKRIHPIFKWHTDKNALICKRWRICYIQGRMKWRNCRLSTKTPDYHLGWAVWALCRQLDILKCNFCFIYHKVANRSTSLLVTPPKCSKIE